jgi:ABC transport system ATP-binding/permease protein
MGLLSVKDLQISFSGQTLFSEVHLNIEKGEKICLVGRNGTGKSTIMKILAGQLTPDEGEILRAQGLKVSMLEQTVPSNVKSSIFEVMSEALGSLAENLVRYHQIHTSLGEQPSERKLKELEEAQRLVDDINGWDLLQKIENMALKMSLDPEGSFNDLSAGLKRRVLLARALLTEPDILIMDEPTNHLDLAAIQWVEETLRRHHGAVFFVSHDRAFIQNMAGVILELDRGKLRRYETDYHTYLERRELELKAEEHQLALFDKKLAQEEAWIRQGIKARRTRNEGRVRNLKKLRTERSQRRNKSEKSKLQINEAEKSGRIVIKAQNLGHGFSEGQTLIDGFDTTLYRGDKIAIVGPNGVGKTTLIQILLGNLKPETGTVKHGTHLEVAYFDQLHSKLDPERTVFENIGEGSDHIDINGKSKHVLGYLQDFLFSPQRARGAVSTLSGGERNRLLLAKIFTRPANVLVLDEPTNDLDVETLELLEETLLAFGGTILFVSHDRAFVDNVATSTIAFDDDGIVREYVGGYSDWQRQKPMLETTTSTTKEEQEKPDQLTPSERKELHNLPKDIEKLEKKQSSLHLKMEEGGFYDQTQDNIQDVLKELEAIDKKIEKAYSRWELLENRV